VHALAHITGGGLTDNIPRVLPEGLEAVLERASWPRDPVFEWLRRSGRIEAAEMYRTFNCGIGMTVLVPAARAQAALEFLAARGERAHIIGEVRTGSACRHPQNERRCGCRLISGRGSNMSAIVRAAPATSARGRDRHLRPCRRGRPDRARAGSRHRDRAAQPPRTARLSSSAWPRPSRRTGPR
jgi:hypothetical protein